MLTRRGFVGCAICAAAGLTATAVQAQSQSGQGMPGLKRTLIRRTEYPGDKYVTLLMMVEIAGGTQVPRHIHPGIESTYVIEGGGTLAVQGEPDRETKAGDAFQVPPEVPHLLHNGPATTRIAVTYVVEKDKPLVTLVPG